MKSLQKYLILFALTFIIPVILNACGDDKDEPQDTTQLAGDNLSGVWKWIEHDEDLSFLQFENNNKWIYYDVCNHENAVSGCHAYYTYDANSSLVILHWCDGSDTNNDADIYKIKINGSVMTLQWIDDVSEQYDYSYFNSKKDLEIISKYADKNYSIKNPDDIINFTKSSLEELQSIINKLGHFEWEDCSK